MLSIMRPRTAGALAAELGRAEIAARLAMVGEPDDLDLVPRSPPGPYGWFGAGLAVSCAVLGVVFLFGPA